MEHEELVRLLLAKGANPNENEAFTKRGKCYCQSCLEHAMANGSSAIAKLLVEAGAVEAVHTACRGAVRAFRWGGSAMYRRGGVVVGGADGDESNPGLDQWAVMEQEDAQEAERAAEGAERTLMAQEDDAEQASSDGEHDPCASE